MQQSVRESPLFEFASELWDKGVSESLLIQFLVAITCLVASYLAARRLRPALKSEDAKWRMGSEGLARVLFPLLSWLLISVAHPVLPDARRNDFLAVIGELSGAWAVVRMAVYLVQEVFLQSAQVKKIERWIAGVLWLGVALHILGWMSRLRGALDEIQFDFGKTEISLLKLVDGAISVGLTMLIAMWLGRIFERRMMQAQSFDMSLRVVATKVVRTVLAVFAILIALPLVGIDLTVLSVFGGALGVGLGFGLQKIASNYVSGFIILLDRSIRIGDLVTIDGRNGAITGITARYVVLRMGDGTEAIIPNEALVTSTVLNHSYTDRQTRVPVQVTVAHGTDIDLTIGLIKSACAAVPRVLADPQPHVFVKAITDTGIELEIGVWVGDPEAGLASLRSEVNLTLLRTFKGHGIELPTTHYRVTLSDTKVFAPADGSVGGNG
ncbi:mechanosensitive ion channel [Burkholderiaceae bacterium DAT-1]|nr:mechanosensitive ion channel [Burkholderiaceae bacterium DAT-1]